jgi:hypothetical protein
MPLDSLAACCYTGAMAATRKTATRSKSGQTREPNARCCLYIGLQSRGVFALPADVRKRHRLDEPGAQLRVVERDDGVIELHPQLAIPAEQAWFWSEHWQAKEIEANDDIAAGRIRRHASGDALLEHLDELRESS